ncbi:hypothetical protein MAP00_000192 [Monascus purpureus]|nr:hypothetical protein MAP00_000192 [Monascus purpureus]
MEIFRISPDRDVEARGRKPGPPQAETSFRSTNSNDSNLPLSPNEEEKADPGDTEKLVEMMAEFSAGFDPGSFADRVKLSRPHLKIGLFPGSYSHLLLILLEPWVELQKSQKSMTEWLRDRYPNLDMDLPAPSRPSETNITDQTFFGAEVEMLRKLLAPLREDSPLMPIFWINTRQLSAEKMCDQLEASKRAIEEFKDDVAAVLGGDNDTRSIYFSLPVGWKRMSLLSKRQLRMDACRATLSWDDFCRTDLDFTSFFHYYKAHICKLSPDRAMEMGWLPPKELHLPNLSLRRDSGGRGEGATNTGLSTPSDGSLNVMLNLMFDTARWLALARGLPAVHLFCDVARLFSGLKPPANADRSRLELLHYFSQIRVTSDGIPTRPPTPFPWQDRSFANRNPDYFIDLWKSSRGLANDVFQSVSLLEKRRSRANSGFRLCPTEIREKIRMDITQRIGIGQASLPNEPTMEGFAAGVAGHDRRASLPGWFMSARGNNNNNNNNDTNNNMASTDRPFLRASLD